MSNKRGTPEAEITVDEPLVRTLLRAQHPDLANASLSLIDSGWDNVTFRLGDDLAVRLPRREVAAILIENEQAWLPALAEHLPLPVPAPVKTGRPQQGYPWSWSIVPWLEGNTADLSKPGEGQAVPLAAFLRALHQPAPSDAPLNDVRGVPLEQRAESVEERLKRLRAGTDLISPSVDTVWADALQAAPANEARWLHGDLHPRNVLVDDGRLAGIIDWGDITSGDVATDLASIWMLLPTTAARQSALVHYAADEATTRRALGWAVLFGAVLLDTGLVDNPRHAAVGKTTLERVTEDWHQS